MRNEKGQFVKGQPSWNSGTHLSGMLGKHHTKEGKKNIGKPQIGEKNHNWKGGLPKCPECGKELSNRETKICKQCFRGEYHFAYIKDRTKLKKSEEERNDYAHREWSKNVKNRDGWKCKINNKDCEGKVIAHHILSYTDYPELRYEINNGITLCHAHHPIKWAEEKRLIPFFTGLVSVSNQPL
ncbi:hypothetical protein M0R04_13025 [Candidatus Dojkabacteria bacterium]|jgi:hypothetical protein|nr:hypothetical protein [Candidatus Dojkabacteria bacterium]